MIVQRVGKEEDVAATAQKLKAGCATLQRGSWLEFGVGVGVAGCALL